MESQATNGKFPEGSAAPAVSDGDKTTAGEDETAVFDVGKPASWQRMRWTDEMVRFLIAIVAYVGDDSPADSSDQPRRSSSTGPKKGKWRAVSMLMNEKGCLVSPQQCEDKFNDLNKRYKRLNDILGRGTTCDVVANPCLLDTMTHLSEKARKDAIRILCSKQLFYREMCAYHNGQRIPNMENLDFPGINVPKEETLNEGNGNGDKNEEKVVVDGVADNGDGVDEKIDDFLLVDGEGFNMEVEGLIEERKSAVAETRHFLSKRSLQLREERLELEAEGLELKKQRLKWMGFKRKKEWEMKRMRLENERMLLENEQMDMEVRRKVLELDQMADTAAGMTETPGFQMEEDQPEDQMGCQ